MGSKKPWDDRRKRPQDVLRHMRKEAGLNQQELADRMGVDQSFVSRFERGERRLDLVELQQICDACGTDLSHLIKRYRST